MLEEIIHILHLLYYSMKIIYMYIERSYMLYMKYMIKRELYYKRESSMIHPNRTYIKELEG